MACVYVNLMGTLTTERADAEEKFRLRILARAACILIRREWNVGQAELAALCRTHQQVISQIERGRAAPSMRVCRLLIEAAGIIRVAPQASARRPLAQIEARA